MYSPYVVHIDTSCCGCGACVRQCVRENLAITGSRVEPKDGYVCVGCMACAKWCPTRALTVKPAKPVSAYLRAR